MEAKYPGVLVVIGVHSPKFPHEKKTASIRKAILRYNVDHPVVNDENMVLWNRYGVQYWPTYVLIDPDGRFYGKVNGEGLYKQLDYHIGKLVKQYSARGKLKKTPLHFALEREQIKGPLFFPGKVLADAVANRLFIADSSNNRIVITDLDGKKVAVAGTGKEGKADGPFDKAMFADPQGLAFDGSFLYVADRKNHTIRALDLKAKKVKTIAGTGHQDRADNKTFRYRPALTVGLNSPWGLALHGSTLYIGMAGHHQIWVMDLKRRTISPFAGDGDENIKDGPLAYAKFSQPSGVASDGRFLYVADSEDSGIRALPLSGQGPVMTIVGSGLFDFGDVNGQGGQVRLQHALDVTCYKNKLYVADTYNHKIKMIDPMQRTCVTFAGDTPGTFDEPSGLSISGAKMYVADSSNHRIRVIDMATNAISTLDITGVDPVRHQTGSVSKK